MQVGEIGFTAWALFVFATSIALLVFGWRSKQFENFEQAKYQVLEDKEPAAWPGREAAPGSRGRRQGGAGPGRPGAGGGHRDEPGGHQ